MSNCVKCNKSLNENDQFCPSCGTNVKSGKKELSDAEKAAKQIINFFITLIVLAGFLYFLKVLSDENLREYKAKKQLELLK